MLCQRLEGAICLRFNSLCRFSVHANVKGVDMSSRLYFAYGSNLDFDQMAARCPNAEYVGIATLKDHVLKLDSAGYATVVAQPGAHVQGALWNLDRCDEAKLDGFEGVETGCYHKEDITVDFVGKHDQDDVIYGYQERSAAGVSLDALIYLSDRPPFGNATFRPEYLDRVRNGAENLRLDGATLGQIRRFGIVENAEYAIAG